MANSCAFAILILMGLVQYHFAEEETIPAAVTSLVFLKGTFNITPHLGSYPYPPTYMDEVIAHVESISCVRKGSDWNCNATTAPYPQYDDRYRLFDAKPSRNGTVDKLDVKMEFTAGVRGATNLDETHWVVVDKNAITFSSRSYKLYNDTEGFKGPHSCIDVSASKAMCRHATRINCTSLKSKEHRKWFGSSCFVENNYRFYFTLSNYGLFCDQFGSDDSISFWLDSCRIPFDISSPYETLKNDIVNLNFTKNNLTCAPKADCDHIETLTCQRTNFLEPEDNTTWKCSSPQLNHKEEFVADKVNFFRLGDTGYVLNFNVSIEGHVVPYDYENDLVSWPLSGDEKFRFVAGGKSWDPKNGRRDQLVVSGTAKDYLTEITCMKRAHPQWHCQEFKPHLMPDKKTLVRDLVKNEDVKVECHTHPSNGTEMYLKHSCRVSFTLNLNGAESSVGSGPTQIALILLGCMAVWLNDT